MCTQMHEHNLRVCVCKNVGAKPTDKLYQSWSDIELWLYQVVHKHDKTKDHNYLVKVKKVTF